MLVRAFILMLSWLLAIPIAQAFDKPYTHPALSQANESLLENPTESLTLSEQFLNQADYDFARLNAAQVSDYELQKTPSAVVDALKIKAEALAALNEYAKAQQIIEQAIVIAQRIKQPKLVQEARFVQAQLLWGQREDTAALAILQPLKEQLSMDPASHLAIQVLLLCAEIHSHQAKPEQAEHEYRTLQTWIDRRPEDRLTARFRLGYGQHLVNYGAFDSALPELMAAQHLATRLQDDPLIALSNLALANLYYQRRIYDQALDTAMQAAEYFEHYQIRQELSQTLTLIADIYQAQGRYNHALVHYFNALDHEQNNAHQHNTVALRLSIAEIYHKLYNLALAEDYLAEAQNHLATMDEPSLTVRAALIAGEIAEQQSQWPVAQRSYQQAVKMAEQSAQLSLQARALKALSELFEKQSHYDQALAAQRQYEAVKAAHRNQQRRANINNFMQQQEVLSHGMMIQDYRRQADHAREELWYQQRVSLLLGGCLVLLLLLTIFKRYQINHLKRKLYQLRTEFYTHHRSGLRNLRLLSAKLPDSMQQSSHHFEQWQLGEVIHEPLSDRLRFALIDIPFLKRIYQRRGYQEALDIERQFGQFLNAQVQEPGRIYHIADTLFLFIEPNPKGNNDPAPLASRLEVLVAQFTAQYDTLSDRIMIGLADYPFVPKAVTAINDQELIDILLMTVEKARTLSEQTGKSQWIHLGAIDSAPAATFTQGNIRQSCYTAMAKGLVRVQSSYSGDISWKPDHDFNN
ncbi:hypothetical protein VST7929_02164 [Vibrio stylophorae]|uniref:GGDEF domain-containing protein n=1 Tax=Vibrio stylophorae TaxID=659351 RepID=A0ABM8ZVA3_9VIBR|nr:GGDEF domain-containing protein [Vibrio stylophorae]CAH0534249.1 hypothetical protein VST7929_02164 [Vibrio stylophorae]